MNTSSILELGLKSIFGIFITHPIFIVVSYKNDVGQLAKFL